MKLKYGDIIAYKPANILEKISYFPQKIFNKTPYFHVGIYIGDGRVLESVYYFGVIIRGLGNIEYYNVFRLPNKIKKDRLYGILDYQFNYDIIPNEGRLNCCELVEYLYGLKLKGVKSPDKIIKRARKVL